MLNVIFIDDEPYVLTCIPHIIDWNKFGINITGLFNTVRDAKEHIKNNPTDIIFTDIAMPNEDGFEIAAYCYENFPDIKVVFISAYKNFDFAQKAFSLNVFDYLSKPLTYESLTKVIDRISKYYNNSDFEEDDRDIVSITKKYLEENYKKDVSLSQVAATIGLSPAYFSSTYKVKSGESFVTTLNKIRINHAKKLILDKTIKISHIHSMVGYQTRSYFFKIFKEICGISPSEYRTQHQQNKSN